MHQVFCTLKTLSAWFTPSGKRVWFIKPPFADHYTKLPLIIIKVNHLKRTEAIS